MDYQFVRDRIKTLIDARGLNTRDLSVQANMGEQRLRHFLAGRIQAIKPQDLRAILAAAAVTDEQFFDTQRAFGPTPQVQTGSYQIPIYGEIPAGNATWIDGQQTATEFVIGDERDRRRKAFGLRVSGRSMEPKYLNGDLLILRPLAIPLPIKDLSHITPRATFDALHGRTVAVLINGEATLKLLEVEPVKSGDYFLHLRPINPAYQSVTIQPNDEALFQGEVYKSIREE